MNGPKERLWVSSKTDEPERYLLFDVKTGRWMRGTRIGARLGSDRPSDQHNGWVRLTRAEAIELIATSP